MRHSMKVLPIVQLLVAIVFARPSGSGFLVQVHNDIPEDLPQKENKCGYESCPVPKADMLNVHLVPHTHDDVGWLKTLDQYYYGSNTKDQKAGVQYILDSVVHELLKDPERKFIYVESAFFFKWWDEQTAELQQQVYELVQQGRLEFVGGAWSMNDEAAAHYQSVIDQFTWGLRMLNDTFGECGRPRAGWQIDPFGHSREQASLFAQMGYDGLFFARLDWNDKSKRLVEKSAEMIWKSSANLETNNELFTSVLYNHYSAPPGFCFDVLCSDDPFIDGPYSAENNVAAKVDIFLDFVKNMSARYRTNNVILTMGDDFNYMDALMYFKNLDKLIKYTNARQAKGSKVNVFYSTPTCYLKAVHDSSTQEWPTKSDDFFPYATDPHTYWTGYYTSRPTSKRFERVGNHLLQVCKQFSALATLSDEIYQDNLDQLRDALGVMQHHDAITGTEKQHVADDYARMLYKAIEGCGDNIKAALNRMNALVTDGLELQYGSCHLLNISHCETSESKESFVVTVYNPLAHSSYLYVRLPVNGEYYTVKDGDANEFATQMVPIPGPVANLAFRPGIATHELIFLVHNIAPMGYLTFYVSERYEPKSRDNFEILPKQQSRSISNEHLTLRFDDKGFLSKIVINNQTHRLQQDFLFYEGAYGNNAVFENRSSGAYIFRPNGTEKHVTQAVKLEVYRGRHIQEVHQKFNDWISQVIRLYDDEAHVEFEWLVGPIPIDDGIGKEVITRYYSDIQSDGVFWTDSNGREMMKRVRNHRDTWDLKLEEPVAGNYYPITAKIALEDSKLRMAVLNDRAQGGTSMEDGVIELMVHRRLLRDDAFGVGEALNETAYGAGLVARGKHYLMFEDKRTNVPSAQRKERVLQNQVLTPPWMFISDATNLTFDTWSTEYANKFAAMDNSLPENINLLTFEPWKDASTYLVRFEYLLEKNEDPSNSKPVTLNLQGMFLVPEICSFRETNLAANQWKADESRLTFSREVNPVKSHKSLDKPNDKLIVLNPMEIRTFVMEACPPE